MKTTFYLFLSSLCLAMGVSQAQTPQCGTNNQSDEFQQLIRQMKRMPASGQGRLSAEPTRVAIKATLLLGSTGTAPSQATLDTVLVYLNSYFKPLNINFYWLGQPTAIRDNKYANTYDFPTFYATTAAYNVDNAVNLYFGLISAYGNGSSFASLPSQQKASNYVYINSLLANVSPGYLASMLRSVIPHEFGHYFGLNHTFINSNSKNIGERELVTRGPGANCENQGDLICDTPADPYDRLLTSEVKSWSVESRTCTLKATITDANGAAFDPDVRNLMSYYSLGTCSGDMHFSPGQYERMQLGLAVRLNNTCVSNEVYTITGDATTTPRVAIDRIVAVDNGTVTTTNVQNICLGATLRVAYSTSGSFNAGDTFQIEGTTNPFANDLRLPTYTKFPSESVTGQPGQLAVRIADSTLVNRIYYIRARPVVTPSISCVGATSLLVMSPGTVRVAFNTTSADTMSVNFGQSVAFRVSAEQQPSGQGYGNGRILVNNERIPYITLGKVAGDLVSVTLYKNSRVRVLDALVGCGFANLAGNLTVTVRPPGLALQQPANQTVCAGATLTIPFMPLTTVGLSQGYRAQLSDAGGHFTDDSTGIIGSADRSPMMLRFPDSLPGSATYRVRLLINTPQGWVAALPGPAILVSELPTALLTATPTTILTGDSAPLTIQLTGQSPWLATLSDGQVFTLINAKSTVLVKPEKTTAYQVVTVRNACGTGSVSGTALVTVLQPLAVEPPVGTPAMRIWPNPAGNDITVEFLAFVNQLITLRITDVSGKLIQTVTQKGTGNRQHYHLTLTDLPIGAYQLSLDGPTNRQTVRFLKK